MKERAMTGEYAILILCPICGTEHWIDPKQSLESCDICQFNFPEPEENGEDE